MKQNVTFTDWNCKNEPVFLRADLNVPLSDGKILSDHRLQAIRPTLDALIKKNAIIVLATHMGRPTDNEPTLSTKQLLPWFKKYGYRIIFCKDPEEVKEQLKRAQPGTILLLENLRFFPGEKGQDPAFAQQLKELAKWYVNDAFGAAHRTDSSLTLLAELFPKERRSLGLLVIKELELLDQLLSNPAQPFGLILGGGKVADKLPLIEHFIGKASFIMLGPAMVFTFLKALGKEVGKSFVDDEMILYAKKVMKKAQEKGTKVSVPVDYLVAKGSVDGPLSIVDADQFPSDGIGISIGPKTIAQWKPHIEKAGTVFFNGSMGFSDRPDTLSGMEQLLTVIAQAPGKTVVAGGDSVAIVNNRSVKGITYCSSGGGATLTYLSGKDLPALKPFD